MIAAGQLNKSVTFYSRADSKESDYGSIDETFSEGITCRAAVKYISGAETIQSETLANTTIVQFSIRYRADITETGRILYDGYYYTIRVIEVDDKKTTMKITTDKIVT